MPTGPPRLALTDHAGRLRVLSVHEGEMAADVVPPVKPNSVEEGPLPRLAYLTDAGAHETQYPGGSP